MGKKENKFNKLVSKIRPNQMGQRIIYSVVGIIVLLLIVFGFFLHHYVVSSLKPLNPGNETVTQVDIPSGSSQKKIGEILQDDKIVKSGTVFEYYVKSHNINDLKSGYYQLTPAMSPSKITKQLRKGGSIEPIQASDTTITIKPGETNDEIADTIDQKTDFSGDDFLDLVESKSFYKKMSARYSELLKDSNSDDSYYTGYLCPATYKVVKGETLNMLLSDMLQHEDRALRPLYKVMKKDKLSVAQTITIASIINQQGVSHSDQKIMSGIIRNRIKKGKENQMKKGPTNNPGIQSINAALYPSQLKNNYFYYFVNPENSKVYYSKTFKQNQQNIRIHQ